MNLLPEHPTVGHEPYKCYRPSGIKWLADVPVHWNIVSLRWVCKRYAGGTPDKTNDSFWEDGIIPWINSGAVNQMLIAKPSAYITQEAYARSSAKWVPAGALVMALAGQGKTKGMVAQLRIKTTCNQSMAAIVPDGRVKARFLFGGSRQITKLSEI
jgi:type I restriction enzyme S subunit